MTKLGFAPELEDYLTEREEFLGHEVKWANLMCGALEDSSAYKSSISAFAQSLSALHEYCQQLRRIALHETTSVEDQLTTKRILDSTCATLAELLNVGTVSLLQRRKRSIRHVSAPPLTTPRVRLSEVHIQYPSALRAIECISNEFHAKLNKAHPFLAIPAPLLILTGGTETAVRNRVLYLDGTRGIPKLDDASRRIKLQAQAGYILLPRWCPNQIRYAALLAHEHIHNLLWPVVHECMTVISERYPSKEIVNVETARASLGPVADLFGDNVIELAVIRRRLHQHMIKLANSFAEVKKRGEDAARYYSILHVDEFLADAGAIALAGPAFLFSAMHDLRLDDPIDFKRSEHPPSVIRLHLQVRLLSDFGFASHVDAAASLIEQQLFRFCATPSEREYRNWTMTIAWPLISRFSRVISKLGTNTKYGSIDASDGTRDSSYWSEHWDAVADAVHAGNILRDKADRFTPSDYLNAMWRSRLEHGITGKRVARLAWRMAIENCS